MTLELPKIDLSFLPDLQTLTGLFANYGGRNPGHDDSIVVLATFLYEATPPGGASLF